MAQQRNKQGPSGSSPTQGRRARDEGPIWELLERALRYADDLGGVALGAFATVTLLGLLGWTQGGLVDPWVAVLRKWLGLGSFLVPAVLLLIAIALFNRRRGQPPAINWVRIIALELAIVGLLSLLSILDGMDLPRAESGYGGGLVGWGIASLLGDLLGAVGRIVLLLLLLLVSASVALRGFVRSLRNLRSAQSMLPEVVEQPLTRGERAADVVVRTEAAQVRRRRDTRLPREYRKTFKIREQPEEKPVRPKVRDERLPELSILEEGKTIHVTASEINTAAGLIEKTLADFGLPVRVVNYRAGPTVTQFAVEPGYLESIGSDGELKRQKVRVSQISSLASDLALALSAPTLRVEAPVPGRAYVGIEVPNRRPAIVRLRPILESDAYQAVNSPLAIALGRDVAGASVVADLISMPHLLIAGTTGSGKSVCITSIATTLAFENSPEDLRLVMIDPKMVELLRFNGLPHLLGKVETELERITGVLRWCTLEMDRRYRLLEEASARDIEAYNRRMRRRRDGERLPRVVIMIDELADLMMMAPDETEQTLVRLAQMARAVGLHLVLATQRPSTDILTGLIKANFPARISFAVASGVDSRVILDATGAETLLGRGDMLYLSPEAGAPIRLQGVIVVDKEIERLIDHWQTSLGDDFTEEVEAPWEDLLARKAALEDRDEILEQAIELVRERGEASASMLQRSLRVGYPRAARLMDELEELGVVGRAQKGGKTREVLIGSDEDPISNLEIDEGGEDEA